MRLRILRLVAAALACWTARALAADPVEPAPPWRHGYGAVAGLGYYERLHLGVGFLPSPRSAVEVFAGSDLGVGDDRVWEVGLGYRHAIAAIRGWAELGWDAKALYWDRSSARYDWRMMSVVAGGYLSRELGPRVALALDGGVALSFSLDTVRKQNVYFEYPTRWNGSVCLALRYRFDEW